MTDIKTVLKYDKKKETRKGYIVNIVVIIAALIIFGIIQTVMMGGGKGSYQLIFIPSLWQCSYLIILAVSLNLVLGFLGQLSLGHCGFMAIGAYTAALVSLAFERAGTFEAKESFVYIAIVILAILLGGIFAAVIGLVVGIPALRLKGDYLAIITLGFGMIIVNVINNLPFAGQEGLGLGSAAASLYKTGLGFNTNYKVKFAWLAIIITLLSITVMFMFIRSKFGRTIIAIREDEIAASASGINVSKYKIGTFVLSAFFAGIAGGIYACCNGSLSTSSFAFANGSILNSTFIVVMVVLGGMGSLTGSVLASVGMFLLNYLIKNVINVSGAGGFIQNIFNYPMLVYAIVLIIIILFKPRGLLGTKEFSIVNFKDFISRDKNNKHGEKAEKKGGVE
ncbi:MAG: branched-chain amino acid ABC transporter permease [Candidatus Metalachnospira sp.]|nr:branched-chain amino acid ABC transporter permease [Candidatus Metalachnospira sp.]